jgi:co-chaperonin GroES (HSP10)
MNGVFMSKIRANSNKLIVEFESGDDLVEKDGIFIPHRAVENSKLTNGIVLSVGPKCELGIEEGDRVLYDKHAINRYSDTIGAVAEDCVILIEK